MGYTAEVRAGGYARAAALVAALVCAQTAPAQESAFDLLERRTLARIRAVADSLDGALGVAAIDLKTGRTLALHPDIVCPSASTIKVPIMMELFRQVSRGAISLDQRITLQRRALIPSSERLETRLREGPAEFTIRELIEAMIEVSDNTATNALIDLAGMQRVNGMLDEFGLRSTRLRRRMLDAAAARRGDDNTSTPAELARIAALLYRGNLSGGADMLAIMKRVSAGIRKAVPASVEVASKPGDVPGARSELAIVYVPDRPFAVGIMSAFIPDGKDPVPEVAAILYSHFDRLGKSNQYGNRLE